MIFTRDERFSSVTVSSSGEDAVEKTKELKPDVILMDINLPGINGFEATKLIKQYSPDSKILGVSLHSEPAYARKMMQWGAMGYITKNSHREEMLTAIFEISEGKKYICDEIKTLLVQEQLIGEEINTGISSLSERELEIVKHITKGASSKEIAVTLNISVKTVEVHRYNILRKLKLKNAAALVNFANKYQAN